MKNVLIFTILGGFFSLVLFYILKEFSPFELSKIDELIKLNSVLPGEWDKLNTLIQEQISKGLLFQYLSSVAYLAFGVGLAAILSFLTAIHLFLDKLFFRSYYENPSLYNAIRRSTFIVITIGLVVYMKLSLLETQTIVLVPVAALILELIIASTINPFLRSKLTKVQNKVKNANAQQEDPKPSNTSDISNRAQEEVIQEEHDSLDREESLDDEENLENPDKLDE